MNGRGRLPDVSYVSYIALNFLVLGLYLYILLLVWGEGADVERAFQIRNLAPHNFTTLAFWICDNLAIHPVLLLLAPIGYAVLASCCGLARNRYADQNQEEPRVAIRLPVVSSLALFATSMFLKLALTFPN